MCLKFYKSANKDNILNIFNKFLTDYGVFIRKEKIISN
jgi:hypothetical protein